MVERTGDQCVLASNSSALSFAPCHPAISSRRALDLSVDLRDVISASLRADHFLQASYLIVREPALVGHPPLDGPQRLHVTLRHPLNQGVEFDVTCRARCRKQRSSYYFVLSSFI